jgi:hypothetical protein
VPFAPKRRNQHDLEHGTADAFPAHRCLEERMGESCYSRELHQPKLSSAAESICDCIERSLKALRVLDVERLPEARWEAEQVLAGARRCRYCSSLLAHIFDRIGSTLFLDDDPDALVEAFDVSERDRFSRRVLAACIVLMGRPREAASP